MTYIVWSGALNSTHSPWYYDYRNLGQIALMNWELDYIHVSELKVAAFSWT